MAGNEWLNGYLEAILDAGAKGLAAAGGGRDDDGVAAVGAGSSLLPGLNFSPTKYFVEEVVNSSDEADLHKTWVKVIATRNSRERNNRLENICWRIWHLARKKKQIQLEGAKGLARRRSVREQGRHDASEDISELSEGEKGGGGGNDNNDDSVRGSRMQLMNSNAQMWLDEDEDTPRRLYIVLVSLHGLVRGENMELGRDSDTGGQVKYVVELARALAATKGIYRVDLLTRQILSSDVDWSYGEPVEMLTRPSDMDSAAETSGAYIIRLPCGPRDKYLAKESLWPYVPEFVDRALAHIMDVGRALGEQVESAGGKAVWPYVIHGHYADAGDVAARLSGALNVPMVLTGHSLGRNKFEQLLKQGRLSKEEINSTYKIMRRIEAEEFALDAAEMVVTSTRQEIDEQWGLYDGFDLKLERKLRVRRKRGVSCLGRHMPRMVVIPPGMDFSYVKAQDHHDSDGDLASLISNERAQGRRKLPPIWSEVMRFFTNPHKPMILALSRPDPKKNVTTLIRAFGESRHLRELANMTLILGNRDDVEEMAAGPSGVLTTVLKLIDKYDLYGSVAYPKHHKQHEVPEIYRLAAKTKGVFINPALVEPFGLTLIEAAAYGLPVVATKNGGPVDIIKALNNGLLVDPHDHKAISEALLKLVADKSRWQDCRRNGLRNIHRFSWPEHCRNYLSHVDRCRSRHPSARLLLDAPQRDDPLSDSLKDLSLRFSVDDSADPAGATAALIDALRRSAPGATANGAHAQYSHGRRRRLAVVAVDCYGADGRLAGGELRGVVRRVAAAAAAGGGSGSTGLVVMTGATAEEAVEALGGGLLQVEVDALVCRGGSEIWFPWKDMGSADVEYWAHIEYRWPGDHVKSAVPRLAGVDGGAGGEEMLLLDAAASTSYCYAYSLAPEAKARKIDNLKHRFRMRGFRCKLVYTHACTRLNVMPLFASRAQALRYLSIIWGIDLSKMVMFVGDKGDSDHEELLLGLHNVVVLKGLVKIGSESLLREDDNYKTEDVFAQDSPNITYLEEGYADADMQSALESFGFRS